MHSRAQEGRTQRATAGPGERVHRHDPGGGPACATQAAAHRASGLSTDSAGQAGSNGFRIGGQTVCGLEQAGIRHFQRCVYRADLWFGDEEQVDWFEAYAGFSGGRQKVNVSCMRSMTTGAAFHRAYFHATQQAFLEAHELAFRWFGGVFVQVRYDNLRAVVKKILRGHRREETGTLPCVPVALGLRSRVLQSRRSPRKRRRGGGRRVFSPEPFCTPAARARSGGPKTATYSTAAGRMDNALSGVEVNRRAH
jgi:hypothetical protein